MVVFLFPFSGEPRKDRFLQRLLHDGETINGNVSTRGSVAGRLWQTTGAQQEQKQQKSRHSATQRFFAAPDSPWIWQPASVHPCTSPRQDKILPGASYGTVVIVEWVLL